jgi:hypothetical protein
VRLGQHSAASADPGLPAPPTRERSIGVPFLPGPSAHPLPMELPSAVDPAKAAARPLPGGRPPAGPAVTDRPRYVVLVDDYDLLPLGAGSPLGPLQDLLGLGHEIGLHLVLARGVAGAARAAFEPVFQRLRELAGPCLIMSGDPAEGPLLGGHKAADLPPGRGLLVRRRQTPTMVQVAHCPAPTTSLTPPAAPTGGGRDDPAPIAVPAGHRGTSPGSEGR